MYDIEADLILRCENPVVFYKPNIREIYKNNKTMPILSLKIVFKIFFMKHVTMLTYSGFTFIIKLIHK